MTPSQKKYLETLESRGIEIISVAKVHDGSGKLSVYFQNPNLLGMSNVILGKRGGSKSTTIS
jgi:hypothetical protein